MLLKNIQRNIHKTEQYWELQNENHPYSTFAGSCCSLHQPTKRSEFQWCTHGKHKGLDIVCADGSTIYAPFDVKLNGKAVPYRHNNAINNGIKLSGAGLCFKLFYVKPDKYSGSLKKGQKIGTLLPMQKVYPGITSHIHVQMCDESDPTKYF
uniref:Leukocyte cell-derived chemotaxin-2 n=1 Tax=Denticeps clupeoides TaxID=299321 RepID=A0AAY4CAR3_9TELE